MALLQGSTHWVTWPEAGDLLVGQQHKLPTERLHPTSARLRMGLTHIFSTIHMDVGRLHAANGRGRGKLLEA